MRLQLVWLVVVLVIAHGGGYIVWWMGMVLGILGLISWCEDNK